MSPDVVLIHPPVSLPSEPPVGLGVLAAGLRARGFEVQLRDANLDALLRLVGDVPLGRAGHARERRALLGRERALRLLRSADGYRNLDRYRSAVGGLEETLRLATSPGTRVGLSNYLELGRSPLRSQDLRAAATEAESSPFAPTFEDLADELAGSTPRLVGVSVSYLHQALPAMALCGALRRRLPRARILLGGALLACWRGRLPPESLQPAVDRLVFGDGLGPLLEELGGAADDASSAAPLAPDYSGVPRTSYLAPEPIAPVPLSRGCFWGQCRYCPEALATLDFQPVAPASIPALLDETRRLAQADLLHLSDSALSPAALGALARQRWGARWYGFTRFAPALSSAELCSDLRRSGCLMLQLGLESGSPRVLQHLRKGIDLEQAARSLERLADAGIAVFLYLMFGVPGERREDALQTLEFVAAHASQITYLNTSLLNLPLRSPAEAELELVPLSRAGGRGVEGVHDLGLYTGFRHREGWDRRAARRFLEREFARHPEVAELLRRSPPVFGANHAPFLVEAAAGLAGAGASDSMDS